MEKKQTIVAVRDKEMIAVVRAILEAAGYRVAAILETAGYQVVAILDGSPQPALPEEDRPDLPLWAA